MSFRWAMECWALRDTSDHLDLPQWYEPHFAQSLAATPATTPGFEPELVGLQCIRSSSATAGYENANIWDKVGPHCRNEYCDASPIPRSHGDVCSIRLEARVQRHTLKEWLLAEWKARAFRFERQTRMRVADAAVSTRSGHLWYFPPPEWLPSWLYANARGAVEGLTSLNGTSRSAEEWRSVRSVQLCLRRSLGSVSSSRKGNYYPRWPSDSPQQKPLDLLR